MSSLQKAKSLSLYPSPPTEDPNLFCSPWDSESNAQYASGQFINFLDLNLKYPNEAHKPAAILEEPSSEIPGIESYIQSLRRTQEAGLESPLSVDQPSVETIQNQVKLFKKKKYHAASQSNGMKRRGSAQDISHNEDADTNATSPGITFDSKEAEHTFLTLSKSFKKDLSPSESQSKAINKQLKFRKHRPLTGGNRYPTREASGSQRSLNSNSHSQKGILSRETSPIHQNDVEKMHTQSIKLLLRSRANENKKEEIVVKEQKVLYEDNNKTSMQIESPLKISRFNEIASPEKKEKLKRALSSKQVPVSVKKNLSSSTMISSHHNQSQGNRVFNPPENIKNNNSNNVVVGGFVRQNPMRKRGELNLEDYLTTILETSTNHQKDIVKSIEFTNHIWNTHKNEYGYQAPLLKSMKKQIEGKKILNISSNKRAESPDSIFAHKRPATATAAKANVRGLSMSISSPTSKWDTNTPSDLNNEHYIKNMFSSAIEKKIVDRNKSRSNMNISRFQRPATATAMRRNDRSYNATSNITSPTREESNLNTKDRIVKKGTSESVLWTLKTNLLKCFPETNKGKDRVVVTFKRIDKSIV